MFGRLYNKVFKPGVDSVEEKILTIVRKFGGSEGISIDAIKQYLSNNILDKMPDTKRIQLALDKAVKKGLLFIMPNGKYKAKETAEHKKDTTQELQYNAKRGSDEKESLSKIDNYNDKRIESKQDSFSKLSGEHEQNGETAISIDDITQDINKSTSSDIKELDASPVQEDKADQTSSNGNNDNALFKNIN